MPGIIPEGTSGAVVVRDAGGNCLSPAGVTNAYCPDPAFTSSCELSYLPDGCDARITAAQINAIQSELLCFAESMDPDGNWNCASLCNLSSMFVNWSTSTGPNSMQAQIANRLCNAPTLTPAEIADLPDATYTLCDGAGNLISMSASNVFATPQSIVDAICNDATARTALAGCMTPYPVVAAGDHIEVATATGVGGQITYTVTGIPVLTSIAYNDQTGVLSYTDEKGNTTDMDIGIADPSGDALISGITLNTDTNVMTINQPGAVSGATVNLSDYDRRLYQGASGIVALRDPGGEYFGEVPLWTGQGSAAALLTEDYGLGRRITKNRTTPATVADLDDPKAPTAALGYSSMTAFITNRAAESGTVAGMMNSDGSLGYYSATNLPVATAANPVIVERSNGATFRMSGAAGDIVELPPGRYDGHRLTMRGPFVTEMDPGGAGILGEMVLRATGGASFGGVARNTMHVVSSLLLSPTDIIVRANESCELLWINGVWRVLGFAPSIFSRRTAGSHVRENLDGTATMIFESSLPNQNEATQVTLPAQVSNPASLYPFIQDIKTEVVSAGDPLPTLDAASTIYVTFPLSNTPTQLMIAGRNVNGDPNGSFNNRILIENALLDYAALGGIASY